MEMLQTWKMLAAGFGDRLNAVQADQWDTPSNCSEWTVRELAEHAVDAQRRLPAALGAEVGIELGDDPAAAWSQIMAVATQAYEADGALEQVVPSPFGEQPVGQALGLMTMDMLVHTFDVARSTGGDEQLPEAACAHALEQLQPMDEMIRQSGMFAEKISVPDDATVQAKFIAFTGRQP